MTDKEIKTTLNFPFCKINHVTHDIRSCEASCPDRLVVESGDSLPYHEADSRVHTPASSQICILLKTQSTVKLEIIHIPARFMFKGIFDFCQHVSSVRKKC